MGRGGGTKLKANTAIQFGETADLAIAVPAAHANEICTAIALMNAYGAAGGRCRNGWGSLSLESIGNTPPLPVGFQQFHRPWQAALNLDWAHAIGYDHEASPLIWQTVKNYSDWKQVMRDLAIVKIALRTMFKFPKAKPPHPNPQERHWLSYPITRHGTRAWNKNARLPNSLRFKVRPDAKDPGKLHGVIFHMPCLPPPEFKPEQYRDTIESVWRRVHGFLDSFTDVRLERIPE